MLGVMPLNSSWETGITYSNMKTKCSWSAVSGLNKYYNNIKTKPTSYYMEVSFCNRVLR